MRNRNYILKEPMEILELKNTIFEIKNTLEGLDKKKKRVKELEDRSIENFQSEEHKEKINIGKYEWRLRDLYNNIKMSIYI